MSISQNIRILRKKARLTQIDVAKALGVSIATFRRWEAGETAPTGTRIVELAKVLHVEPGEIIGLKNIVPAVPPVSAITAIPPIPPVPAITAVQNDNMLVFEKGELRIELPVTEKGYELFNRLVERLTCSAATVLSRN